MGQFSSRNMDKLDKLINVQNCIVWKIGNNTSPLSIIQTDKINKNNFINKNAYFDFKIIDITFQDILQAYPSIILYTACYNSLIQKFQLQFNSCPT